MSAKIEYSNGMFHITIPEGEAYQDDDLKRFLDTHGGDYSRGSSSSELGDEEARRWNEKSDDYHQDEAF